MAQDSKKEVTPLFSSEERRALVRNFIEAYLGGTIKIEFAEGDKTVFERAVASASGAFATTSLEGDIDLGVDNGVDFVFRFIFSCRMGGRVTGEFNTTPTVASQLADLHAAVSKTTAALGAIRDWMEKYEPVLREAERDYRDKLGRIQQP